MRVHNKMLCLLRSFSDDGLFLGSLVLYKWGFAVPVRTGWLHSAKPVLASSEIFANLVLSRMSRCHPPSLVPG